MRYSLRPAAEVVVDARAKQPLAPQVWAHERQARQLGKTLVLAIGERRAPSGRALHRALRRRRLAPGLLRDIYLLRIELRGFELRELFQLTPYLAAGAPLLLAWNELGQALTARELKARDERALLARLSAFFDAVRSAQPGQQGAAPRLGVRALDDRFDELRREARLLREPPSESARQPAAGATGASGDPTPSPSPPSEPEPLSEPTALGESTALSEPEPLSEPTALGEPTALSEPVSRRPGPSGQPETNRIAAEWPAWLAAARLDFARWSARAGIAADGTVESLAALDAFADASPENQHELCRHLASIAVYVADIVCQERPARLEIDAAEPRLMAALKLRLDPSAPAISLVERLFEVVQDPEQSLFGLGVQLCRL